MEITGRGELKRGIALSENISSLTLFCASTILDHTRRQELLDKIPEH